eukprot:SAG31_NODE_6884_length_1861_cov_1.061862_1_plen_82_part_00
MVKHLWGVMHQRHGRHLYWISESVRVKCCDKACMQRVFCQQVTMDIDQKRHRQPNEDGQDGKAQQGTNSFCLHQRCHGRAV